MALVPSTTAPGVFCTRGRYEAFHWLECVGCVSEAGECDRCLSRTPDGGCVLGPLCAAECEWEPTGLDAPCQ